MFRLLGLTVRALGFFSCIFLASRAIIAMWRNQAHFLLWWCVLCGRPRSILEPLPSEIKT